jgi:hypothetical protein
LQELFAFETKPSTYQTWGTLRRFADKRNESVADVWTAVLEEAREAHVTPGFITFVSAFFFIFFRC